MAAIKLDVKPFSYENGQDIELWLKRFEAGVNNMLDPDANAATKNAAYARNLPSKLDDFTFRIYDDSANKDNWVDLRAELIDKLSNPAKATSFQDKVDSIKWDGEEPLFVYLNKIRIATKTLDPEVSRNDALFNREVYKRFLAGLPPDFRTYVEVGMPPRSHDVARACERAEKYGDIIQKYNGHPPLAGWALAGPLAHMFPLPPAAAAPVVAAPPAVAPLAAYKTDAIETMNEQLNNLSLAHKENIELQKETNKNINSLLEHINTQQRQPPPQRYDYGRPRSPGPYNGPYRSPNRGYNNPPRSPRWSPRWSPHRGNGNQNYSSQGQPYNQNYNQDQNQSYGHNSRYNQMQPYGGQPYQGQPYSQGRPSSQNYRPNNYQQNRQSPNRGLNLPNNNQPMLNQSHNANRNSGQHGWSNMPPPNVSYGPPPPPAPIAQNAQPPSGNGPVQDQQNGILRRPNQNRVNFQVPPAEPNGSQRSPSPFPSGPANEDF